MGSAPNWQSHLTERLSDLDVDIYNPRRDHWDPYLEQSASNPTFRQQVEWELNALDLVDMIAMYLAPATVSPISLLELGLHASQELLTNPKKLIVCCLEGFHRKGNVDIVCERYGISQVTDLSELEGEIRRRWKLANQTLVQN